MNRYLDRQGAETSAGIVTPRADQFAGMFAPAVVDLFAGCGGWSIGAERAFVRGGYRDRYIDLMVNHWDVAVGVHQANHPMTEHLHASVFEVDPNEVLPGRWIAYKHASPDCTHFSKARGSRPKKKEIRGLAWVVVDWAAKRLPEVITLENVEEFKTWGPLSLDGQPYKRRQGRTFRKWVRALETLRYLVEHRELRACDYGAPTTRKRLFVICTRNGRRPAWPKPTHAPANDPRVLAGKLKPYRTAAECIDWSIPMLSIFATPAEAKAFAVAHGCGVPRRPLKEKTLARIAAGLVKFVINAKRPFLVDIENAGWATSGNRGVDTPLNTITAQPKGGQHAVVDVAVAPIIARCGHGDNASTGQHRWGNTSHPVTELLPTVTGSKDYAVAAATLAPHTVQRYGEREGQSPRCNGVEQPMGTITATGNQAALVAATLQTLNHAGTSRSGPEHRGQSPADPLHTVTSTRDARALVAAMITKHYGGVVGHAADQPVDTVTAKDHNAVTVAHLLKFRGDSAGHPLDEPSPTITAGGDTARDAGAAHAMGLSAVYLSQMYGTNKGTNGNVNAPAPSVTGAGNHSALIAAFLSTYYGNSKAGHPITDPTPTIVGKDRIQLVTVIIDGQTYVIADIAMRMLQPHELKRAQGFPDDYVIDRTQDGTPVSKADQVKLIGNSVPPQFADAIVYENVVKAGVLEDAAVAAGVVA